MRSFFADISCETHQPGGMGLPGELDFKSRLSPVRAQPVLVSRFPSGCRCFMTAPAADNILTPKTRFVQCPQCEQKLPLRSTGPEQETAARWYCATCNGLIEGYCEQALLVRNPQSVLLDAGYFDVSDQPEFSADQRRLMCSLTRRPSPVRQIDRRRSERDAHSLTVPAIALTHDLMPQGEPFWSLVANLSREGVGLVNPGRIKAEYLAMLLDAPEGEPIQVIVQIVRHLQLQEPFFEIGGEFLLRLGSVNGR